MKGLKLDEDSLDTLRRLRDVATIQSRTGLSHTESFHEAMVRLVDEPLETCIKRLKKAYSPKPRLTLVK